MHLEASENPSDSGATDHQPENNESEADGQGLRDSLPGEDHCCGGHQGQPDDQVDPTGGHHGAGPEYLGREHVPAPNNRKMVGTCRWPGCSVRHVVGTGQTPGGNSHS